MSSANPREPIGTFAPWLRTSPRRYGFALLAVLVATLARYGLGLALGLLPPFVLFFPTIIVVALLAGFGPGIFATLLSAASVGYFFWAPLNLYGVSRVRDIIGLGLFSCIGSFIAWLAALYRRREARIREFERVVEGLDEMIVVVDRDYRYVIANRAFLRYRQANSEHVIGRRISEVLDPEVFESAVKEKLDECFQGKTVRYDLRYKYPSLGTRDLFISYFPIGGPDGVDRVACVLRDITERKRAGAAIIPNADRSIERCGGGN